MRGPFAMLVILLAGTMASGRPAAAAGREWLVQVSTGVQDGDDDRLNGYSATVGALTAVRPWLLLGGEATWYEMRSGVYPKHMEEFVASESGYGRSRAVTGALTGRLQYPVHRLSPFLLAHAGIGGLALGDEWWKIPDLASEGTVPGKNSFLWIAGAGLGLRLTAARPWPDMEASVQTEVWKSKPGVFMAGAPSSQQGALRFALAW